ncbi:protein roadkill-like [Phymastichus coffea]|uniref:protein roadkill-like n=1 Tax=Phymastichus coffea TaxID=108790 RepID=UPI00273CE5BB|nr:protein roadkill-like [Phymastichus coffea]
MARSIVGDVYTWSTVCEWKIQNYTSYNSLTSGKDMYIRSPPFHIQKQTWHLRMFPNGSKDKASENYVSLFLYPNKNNDKLFKAKFSYTILNSEQKVVASFYNTKLTMFNDRGRGKSNLLKSDIIMKTDNIIVLCKIFTEDTIIAETIPVKSSNKVQNSKVFKDYLDNAQFSDVKFFVEDRTIFAHKIVLAAHSSVFADMFNNDIQENRDRIEIIEDIKYGVFYKLLRFMYTGETELSEKIAREMLKASEKYKLTKLKHICEIEMSKNFSTDNIIEYLNLADMYEAKHLKEKAMDFIVSHGQEMIYQPVVDSLPTFHAEFLKDVFQSISTQLNKKRKIC